MPTEVKNRVVLDDGQHLHKVCDLIFRRDSHGEFFIKLEYKAAPGNTVTGKIDCSDSSPGKHFTKSLVITLKEKSFSETNCFALIHRVDGKESSRRDIPQHPDPVRWLSINVVDMGRLEICRQKTGYGWGMVTLHTAHSDLTSYNIFMEFWISYKNFSRAIKAISRQYTPSNLDVHRVFSDGVLSCYVAMGKTPKRVGLKNYLAIYLAWPKGIGREIRSGAP